MAHGSERQGTARVSARAPLMAVGAVLLTVLGRADVAEAAPIVFDFEAEALSSSISSLSITQSGLTITVTQPGANFRINNLSSLVAGGVPEFGLRSLLGGGIANRPFVINFSQAVQSVSIDGGDVSGVVGDEFDNPKLEAFSAINAGGTLLDSDLVANCCGGGTGFEFVNLNVEAAGIMSIRFIGGGVNFVSLFFDNLCVDTVAGGCADSAPAVSAPGALALLGAGLAGLGLVRRRRSSG